ncbi:alpha/beta fold hydrolase [Rhodovibrionaceae bacterium A322]
MTASPTRSSPAGSQASSTTTDDDRGATRRFFNSEDGARLSYLEAGSRENPSLILVHGFGAQARFFLPQLRALAQDFHLVAPDLRGHGRSNKGETEPSMALLANDLGCLIDTLQLDDVYGLGWSLGAQVWLSYLQQHNPGQLKGLIVEDMTPKVLLDDSWQQGARGMTAAVNEQILTLMETAWEDYCSFFEPALFADPKTQPSEHLAWVGEIKESGDPAFLSRLWRSLLDQDFRTLLPELTLPVLIAHGGKSHFYDQAVADFWLTNCPNAQEWLLKDCGHTPHLEDTEGFNSLLRDRLKTWSQIA